MTREDIIKEANLLYSSLEEVSFGGYTLFDSPSVAFGSASDPLFDKFTEPGVIGPWFMKPGEWLDNGRTVVSLFFPIGEEIRATNRAEKKYCSTPWAYARIEGQAYITKFMEVFKAWFEQNGVTACVPSSDPRFGAIKGGEVSDDSFSKFSEINETTFGSRWSERHAAYVCGLGTFGLSKGLITDRGIAGRFASVIISAELEPDVRPYTGIYDNCIMCGKCVSRCPVNAIDLKTGKNHNLCLGALKESGVVHAPRYGCGLCQTDVPCESRNPLRRK